MKHLIKMDSTPHGVLGVRHAGRDQQYCEAGEQVILNWQPDAKWGLQEAHYTDGDGNVTPIDLTPVKVDGMDVVVFTMPDDNITVGGTFKRFVLEDWTGDADESPIFNEHIDATDQQRNTALANVSNQTANSTTGKMGYKVLDPTKTFAQQVTAENTIYEIRDVFDLGGNEFTIPSNVKFDFNGGVIKNGTLVGKLFTTQPLKGSNIGLIYGNTVYTDGRVNLERFTILSGLTNKVTVHLEDDLYVFNSIGHPSFYVGKNLSIDGHGFNIFTYGSADCFEVDSNIELKNININATATMIFATIKKVATPSDIIVDNCKIQGICTLVVSNKKATAAKDSYVNNIQVTNCTVNDWFGPTSYGSLFYIADNYFNNVTIRNNYVHNFYGIVFNFTLTNSSTEETLIRQAYADSSFGRRMCVENNIVENDYKYKVWEDSRYYVSGYYCFVLSESGDVVVKGNSFKNIISNDTNVSTYDNYFNVDSLVYTDNVWSDIGVIGDVSPIFGSKSGINAYRCIKNNKFTLTDLGDIRDVENETSYVLSKIYFSHSSQLDTIIIDNNTFNFKAFGLSRAWGLPSYNAFITNNVFSIDKADTTFATNPIIIPVCKNIVADGKPLKCIIKGNFVSISEKDVGVYAIDSTVDSSFDVLNISDNLFVNVSGFGANITPTFVNNNRFIFSNSSTSNIIFAKLPNIKNSLTKITFKDDAGGSCYLFDSTNFYNSKLNIDINCELIGKALFVTNGASTLPVGIYDLVLKISSNDVVQGLYEILINKTENSTTIKSYITDGTIANHADSTYRNVLNLRPKFKTNNDVFYVVNVRGTGFITSISNIKDANIELSCSKISSERFQYCLDEGAFANIPTPDNLIKGCEYYDTTNNRKLLCNGTDWVNLDGSALS